MYRWNSVKHCIHIWIVHTFTLQCALCRMYTLCTVHIYTLFTVHVFALCTVRVFVAKGGVLLRWQPDMVLRRDSPAFCFLGVYKLLTNIQTNKTNTQISRNTQIHETKTQCKNTTNNICTHCEVYWKPVSFPSFFLDDDQWWKGLVKKSSTMG